MALLDRRGFWTALAVVLLTPSAVGALFIAELAGIPAPRPPTPPPPLIDAVLLLVIPLALACVADIVHRRRLAAGSARGPPT